MTNLTVGRRPLVIAVAAIVVLAVAFAAINIIGRPKFSTVQIVERPVSAAGDINRGFASCSRAIDCDVVATFRNDGDPSSGRAVFSAPTYSIAREQQADAHCDAQIPPTSHGASVQASCRLSASAGNYLEDPVTVQVEK
jgi:hypothetical protein